MKKLISFLLVVMMLCSMSVSAFAADTQIGVSAESYDIKATDGTEGSANTELWLQVAANGQIDVTVPLVLVFKTNIDGGKADTANNYKITNNNNANLVVTKIAVTKNTAGNPMKLVAFGNDISKLDNTYMVKLTAYKSYAPDDSSKNTKADVISGGSNTFDLFYDTHKNNPESNGIFKLARNSEDRSEKTDTYMLAEMETSPLSFITPKDQADETKADAESGVKLLTVTYTVGINTNDVYGEEIKHTQVNDVTTDINGANVAFGNNGVDNTTVAPDNSGDTGDATT